MTNSYTLPVTDLTPEVRPFDTVIIPTQELSIQSVDVELRLDKAYNLSKVTSAHTLSTVERETKKDGDTLKQTHYSSCYLPDIGAFISATGGMIQTHQRSYSEPFFSYGYTLKYAVSPLPNRFVIGYYLETIRDTDKSYYETPVLYMGRVTEYRIKFKNIPFSHMDFYPDNSVETIIIDGVSVVPYPVNEDETNPYPVYSHGLIDYQMGGPNTCIMLSENDNIYDAITDIVEEISSRYYPKRYIEDREGLVSDARSIASRYFEYKSQTYEDFVKQMPVFVKNL